MTLLPKEHGAYGQIAFPLIAAFAIAGVSAGGLLIAAAAIAGFVAHEPASILLGRRGLRARRELGGRAAWYFGGCVLAGALAGAGALLVLEPAVRWALAIPMVPALILGVDIVRGEEKSWHGETSAALAFSGIAVPISMAGGRSLSSALAIAMPFALLFVASTLAVRVVILRVRGGGNLAAVAATRRATLALAAGGFVTLATSVTIGLTPAFVIPAAAPGLLTSAAIALRPPQPTRLRALGWTLVAVSLLTTAIVVIAA